MAPFFKEKRKNKFQEKYSVEFRGIKKSRRGNEHGFFCELCAKEMDLACKGVAQIKQHCDSKPHKSNLHAVQLSRNLHTIKADVFTTKDRLISAAEGTQAYHAVNSAQSFYSNSCISSLYPKLFPDSDIAKQYSSAKTKTEAIVVGVLAPLSIEQAISY